MIYIIATPPSVNQLYVAAGKRRHKSGKYSAWIRGELKALLAQRARPILSRVDVTITLPVKTRGDCDNRIKSCLDLLVRAGVLINDSKAYLASVSASFGDDDLCRVSVEPEIIPTRPKQGTKAP